jgi:pimeloyl-ACP methyl ester carboxylesterase
MGSIISRRHLVPASEAGAVSGGGRVSGYSGISRRSVSRGLRKRGTALVAVAVLAAATLSAVPASAAAVSSDQPRPGFTIDNPPLAPLQTSSGPTTVLQGVHDHAGYDIEVPPHWNGDLVLWAHPFMGTAPVLSTDTPEFGLRQLLVDEGYAWAASTFADTGFAVGSGVETTHDLALLAARLLHREPNRRYVVGISMGGQVVARSLEQYPKFYSGAMPMCGSLGDDTLFDYIADVNLTAQALSDIRAYPTPSDYQSTVVPAIVAKLGLTADGPQTAAGRQYQSIVVHRSGGVRPGASEAFNFWVPNGLFQLDLADDGGSLTTNFMRLAQNAFTYYTPNSPIDVNRTVQRIVPQDLVTRLDPGLTSIPRVFGSPQVPVLSLHGIGDLLVPLSQEQTYAREVAAHGESNLLVQRAIREADHCEYSTVETAQGWHDLVNWVQSGSKPGGDDVLNPQAVAAPTFGCRYTDPTAYGDPNYRTRVLYPRCP